MISDIKEEIKEIERIVLKFNMKDEEFSAFDRIKNKL